VGGDRRRARRAAVLRRLRQFEAGRSDAKAAQGRALDGAPVLLAVDLSRYGAAWMRPGRIWAGQLAASEHFTPGFPFAALAVFRQSLHTPALPDDGVGISPHLDPAARRALKDLCDTHRRPTAAPPHNPRARPRGREIRCLVAGRTQLAPGRSHATCERARAQHDRTAKRRRRTPSSPTCAPARPAPRRRRPRCGCGARPDARSAGAAGCLSPSQVPTRPFGVPSG
jgi:hypothetical protein